MKIYIYEDSLFSYKAFAIADSLDEAIKMLNEHVIEWDGITLKEFKAKITEHEIKRGFLTEAGGNG